MSADSNTTWIPGSALPPEIAALITLVEDGEDAGAARAAEVAVRASPRPAGAARLPGRRRPPLRQRARGARLGEPRGVRAGADHAPLDRGTPRPARHPR